MLVYKAKTKEEALGFLNKYKDKDCKVINGGTDLILKIKDKKINPDVLIDISGIRELKNIKEGNDYLFIGSGVNFTEIVDNNLFDNNLKGLKYACSLIGSPQIRNRGTIGGNIINASPAADSVPPLLCLDSSVIIESKEGKRELKLEDLYKNKSQLWLRKDELLTEIKFKKPEGYLSFRKIGARKAITISKLSISTLVFLTNDNIIKDIRISSGALARLPIRELEVEKYLLGKKFTEKNIDVAINILQDSIKNRLYSEPEEVLKREIVFLPYKRSAVKKILREVLYESINKGEVIA